ncbi:hypothetical protein [Georgenia wangjunii]|uniref:hypothetical protein n=1 Tax=Georgenia wangjunii TaxID=3117730 RepID=UPI002F261C13
MIESWVGVAGTLGGAAVGLLGGLIGVRGTLAATKLQQQREDRRAVRPELRDLVVGLWTDAERAWKADQALALAYDVLSEDDPSTKDNLFVVGHRWSEAQEAAWKHLPILQITYPDLAEPAQALVSACRLLGDPDPEDDVPEYEAYLRFTEARDAFVLAARKALAPPD